MSHSTKKSNREESVREKEPPAHRIRRKFKHDVADYVGSVDKDFLEEEDIEVDNFEPLKRKKR